MWTCSQAWAEAFSPASSSDGEPSQRVRLTPGADSYLYDARTTPRSRPALSGTTCAPFPASLFEVALTSYLADFPVKTSPSPARRESETSGTFSEEESISKPRGAACGQKCGESSRRSSRASPSSKTCPRCGAEGSIESFETLPRSGMMRRGTVSELPTWEPRISGIEYGSLLPTPTAGDAKASGSRNTTQSKAHAGTSLTDWARGDKGEGRMLPTPCSTDHKGGERKGQLTHSASGVVAPGQKLNPHFAAWMMGLPDAWISFEPLGMDKFRSWQRLHSACLRLALGPSAEE